MQFGIIAEGRSDQAVLLNLLYGLGLIESELDVSFLRPLDVKDSTEMSSGGYKDMSDKEFGGWFLIKKDCEKGEIFDDLFTDNPYGTEQKLIIQIDTAECEEVGYDIQRPNKEVPNYCGNLRAAVIDQIKSWINKPEIDDELLFAICIEEIEAWVHALYENKNTAAFTDPKKAFEKYRSKRSGKDKKFQKSEQKLVNKSTFEKYYFYSKDFQKKKNITKSAKSNKSLEEFVHSLSALSA